MKKIFIISAISIGLIYSVNAQISTNSLKNVSQKVSAAASSAGLNVSDLSGQLMTKLNPALSLTKEQEPKVLSAITDFLKSKSGIMSLATSNKTQYKSKLGELTSSLIAKLKPILTATQYAKFLGLKPTTNTASNVLSQLFY